MNWNTWIHNGIPYCEKEYVMKQYMKNFFNKQCDIFEIAATNSNGKSKNSKPNSSLLSSRTKKYVLTRTDDKAFHARSMAALREWLDASIPNPLEDEEENEHNDIIFGPDGLPLHHRDPRRQHPAHGMVVGGRDRRGPPPPVGPPMAGAAGAGAGGGLGVAQPPPALPRAPQPLPAHLLPPEEARGLPPPIPPPPLPPRRRDGRGPPPPVGPPVGGGRGLRLQVPPPHARRPMIPPPLAPPPPVLREGVSIVLPPCNSFIRGSLYESIQWEYHI